VPFGLCCMGHQSKRGGVSSGVYEIVNTVDGKRYVGSASDIKGRWAVHRHGLSRGKHHSRYLQAAWNKHGGDQFVFRALLFCDKPNLLLYEQAAMDALSPEYNLAKFASSCLGVKWSDEAKERIASRPNDHFKGRKHSAETLALMSAAQRGNTATKGKPRNPEAAAKTAAAHRGMKRSEETRARIADALRASWARKKEV
jgi:group I intron endonuclease